MRGPWVATFVALAAALVSSFIQPNVHGLVSILTRAVGYGLGIVVIAMVVALIAVGIRAALRAPFAPALVARTYTVCAMLVAVLLLLGPLALSSHSTRLAHGLGLGPGTWNPAASTWDHGEGKRARETLTQLQDDFKRMQDATALPTEPGQSKPPLQFSSEIQGNEMFDELARLVREMMTEMTAVQQDYLAELERAGVSRLLSAQRIAEDSGLAESRTILTAVRKATQEYKSGAERVLNGFSRKIDATSFDAAAKANMMRHYEQGMVKARPHLQETMELEVQTVEVMGSILQLLESRRAYWQAVDGQFIFEDTKDLERFNGYLATIEQNTQRQAELRGNAQKATNSSFESIKARLPK